MSGGEKRSAAPTAAILVVGTELTWGLTCESNSVVLSRWLSERGITVVAAQKTPDEIGLIASAIEGFMDSTDIIIITGGLGSTHDDVTREALAGALKAPLVPDEAALSIIAEHAPDGADSDSFIRQAYLPKGTAAILPEAGIAPGIVAETKGTLIFSLPGVPREMEMMLERVEKELLARGKTKGRPLVERAGLIGISEPEAARLIAPVLEEHPEITVNIIAKPDEISLTLIAPSGGESAASGMERAFARILEQLGETVFSARGESLPEVVGALLRQGGLTLATAESITAGQIGSLVATVPGSSDYLKGGVIAYANDVKTGLLGVEEAVLERVGAVSSETAAAMAEGARQALGADIGLSVTGIAGPGGAAPEKPVGLVYTGLAAAAGTETFRHIHRGDRAGMQLKTAVTALNCLRRYLLDREGKSDG